MSSQRGILSSHFTTVFLVFLVFLTSTFLNPSPVLAEFEVLDVALAVSVKDREPTDRFSPSAYCEKDKNGQPAIPVIDSSIVQQVYFWTRVASTVQGTVRHTWHQQMDTGWEMIADVDLSIFPSSGYRMWSSKKIDSAYHLGEWMIVVSSSSDPAQVLCITRFTVQ